MMQKHCEDSVLNLARTFLRIRQRRSANTELLKTSDHIVTDAALKFLEEMTLFVPTEVPQIVRRGAFRYDRELECGRITRAQALIHRVAPGPFEDPNYFAILAYQAASIEMAYELMGDTSARDRFSKYLLGTVHSPHINAFSQKVIREGYSIVVLTSGIIDLIYQAAKAIIEALNPSRSVNGRSDVVALFDLEVIRARLDSDSRPTERLYQTLEAYFFNGYPRASTYEAIPEEYGPPLELLVGLAERWIIGHEYGHGLAQTFWRAPANINVDWAKEYFSDNNATIATVFSAYALDRVPPEFALGSAIFTLACLDIQHKAYNVVRTGKETASDFEQESHPKAQDRALAIINGFRQFFDVDYHPNGLFDLSFSLRKKVPKVHNFTSEHSKRAYAYANVLQTVWKPVKDRLLEDFRRKRPLHRIWRAR